MRFAVVPAAVLAGCAALVFAQPPERGPQVEAPGVPAVTIPNPDVHTRLAAQFVATRDVHRLFADPDLPYVRFMSWFDTPPGHLDDDVAFANWWLQQLSFEAGTEPMKEVPGSKGRLFWLDLRDYKWNPGAWRAVAERDFTFLEPWIDHEHAEYLRRVLYAPPSKKALEGREIPSTPDGRPQLAYVLPAGTIVYAPQFIRDTLESDRSPSYYDLLYARFRFIGEGWCPTGKKLEKVKVTKTVDHPGGDYTYPDGRVIRNVPPGRYEVELEETRQTNEGGGGFRFVDFPKDEDDFEVAYGIDKLKVFARESEIDLDFGAVVEGGGDFPGAGSVVARQNRLLVMVSGPFGWYGETYDVKKTSGVRNFNEVLIFGQGKKFRPGRGAIAVRDAGELLATLPNGGLAGLLIDGRGKRLELAGAQFANDTADAHMNPGVRNFGSCVVCHGAAGGFIAPRDAIREGIEKGVDIKVKDKFQRNRIRSFFLGWEAKIKGFQAPYEELLARMTKTRQKPQGWKGADLARYVTDYRHRYDAPLDSATAAAHVGVPVGVFNRVAEHGVLSGPKRLVQGFKVPRSAWDEDYYAVIQLARQAEIDGTEKRRQADARRRKDFNQAAFEARYKKK